MVSCHARVAWVVLGVFAITFLSGADKPSAARPHPSAAKKAPSPKWRYRTGEAAIEAALRSPTQLEFKDTPLPDVIDYLKDYHQIEIQLDKKALDEAGIAKDVHVNCNLGGMPLRSALNLASGRWGLPGRSRTTRCSSRRVTQRNPC